MPSGSLRSRASRRSAAPTRTLIRPHRRRAASRAQILAGENHRVADLRGAGERRLDLAELDAEAADLDLVVDAAEELDGPVRAIAGEVAGAIEPLAGLAEGVWTKRSAVRSGRPR